MLHPFATITIKHIYAINFIHAYYIIILILCYAGSVPKGNLASQPLQKKGDFAEEEFLI